MQIRCASCSRMVEAPAHAGGLGLTCPGCGGDVTLSGAPSPRRPESAGGNVPEGLEVKQLAEGRFRIEYRYRNTSLIPDVSRFEL